MGTTGTAAALTLVFVAATRLTAVRSRRQVGGLVVGTLLGVLVASAAAISTAAVVALAAVAVACAPPGAGTEVVSARCQAHGVRHQNDTGG